MSATIAGGTPTGRRTPTPRVDPAWSGERSIGGARRVSPSSRRRLAAVRIAAQALLFATLCGWSFRVTGRLPLAVPVLYLVVLASSMAFGGAVQRATAGFVDVDPGVAGQLLIGFVCFDSLLFFLMLATPFGLAIDLAVVVGLAALLGLAARRRECSGLHARRPVRRLRFEWCSLATIAFALAASTVWVHEQQPVMHVADGRTVFTVWTDVFIHARLISELAQAHGLGTLHDIKMAGGHSPVYHYASYVIPAALNALTPTSAIDAYVAFQLPFGIVLMTLAAYALVAVTTKRPWSALVGAAAVVAAPDGFEQGFGLRLLGFHFMSQANLGMLYGIACIAVAWIFMIEGCRRGRLVGVALAWGVLALCLTFKAHLFVANALLLLLFPCLFFRGLPRRARVIGAVVVVTVFAAVVAWSQASPRVPTMRLDGSGLVQYVRILASGFDDGWSRRVFSALYLQAHPPTVLNAALVVTMIALASFGAWIVVAPAVLWVLRRGLGPEVLGFVVMVVTSYLAMSVGLALDERGIGAAEELPNRPMAWAYFVLVAFVAAGLARILGSRVRGARTAWRWALFPVAGVLLLTVQHHAFELQTAPGWPGVGRYADFNAAPTCLVKAARFLRDEASPDAVVADSGFDPHFLVTGLAERQLFAADAVFAGDSPRLAERIAAQRRAQGSAEAGVLRRFAAEQRIDWYLLRPEHDAGGSHDRSGAAFRCDGYRVFRMAPRPS